MNRTYDNIMRIKYFLSLIGRIFFLVMIPAPAWAFQTHGGLEGLVSHQMGHVLFGLGMGYMLFRLCRMAMKGPGWFEFKVFLFLIIAWNMITFSGHLMNELVASEKFIKSGGNIIAFSVSNMADVFFFFTRLDHIFLVPSFIFLLLALRKWSMN